MGCLEFPGTFYHEVKQSIHRSAHDSGADGLHRFDLWYSWAMIVTEYTNRRLTVKTDKLVALNGIANLVAERMGSKNFAGIMYRKDDPFTFRDLLWYSLGTSHRVSPYRAPSWSWASVEGTVRSFPIIPGYPTISKIEYLEVQTEPGNMSGQVIGGTLHYRPAGVGENIPQKWSFPLFGRMG